MVFFTFFIAINLAAKTYVYKKMAATVSKNRDSASPFG